MRYFIFLKLKIEKNNNQINGSKKKSSTGCAKLMQEKYKGKILC